jgi:HEAT repeat protein
MTLANLKFLRVLKVATLGALLPLVMHNPGWTQTPTPTPIDLSVKLYIKQLTDENPGNNEAAVKAVKQLGRRAVNPLTKELQSNQVLVQRTVISLLGEIGPDAKDAVKPLVNVLQNDPDFQVRRDTAQALGEIGPPAQDAITPLIASLQNDKDQGVRVFAGFALSKINTTNLDILKAWNKALKSNDLNIQKMAAYQLADSLNPRKSKDIAPILNDVKATLRSDDRWQTRLAGAIVLGGSTQDIKTALSTFNQLLRDQNQEVRQQAIAELGYVGELLRRQAEEFDSSQIAVAKEGLNENIKTLNTLKRGLEAPGVNAKQDIKEIDQLITSLQGTIEILVAISRKDPINQFSQWLQQHWIVSGLLFYGISLLSLWSILLWLRPLWLRQISDVLLQIEKIPLPLPKWFPLPALTRNASLIVFFHYHPRVLDAWVAANLATVQRAFTNQQTVKERAIHIPLPVILNGQDVAHLTSQHLQPEFAKKLVRVLIWGEGGSGKTSLACELAQWAMSDNPQQRLCQHRMLPILLEVAQGLDFLAETEKSLVEIIRGRLRELLNESESICEEFLEQLLKQKRLLVIIDGLSEMAKVTRQTIHPEHPKFTINALLVTSRSEEQLGGVNRTVLKPMRVAGNHLSEFMGSYLTYQDKRDLFTDQEFFEACSHLAAIAQNRDITVLLAKLYADQMIAVKVGTMADNIPNNIPELMLHYLNQLNQAVAENRLGNRTIHHDIKIIAWECLKHTYQPAIAEREAVLAALGYEDAESHLDYLEKRLRVIQTIGVSEEHIRFALDPLAEYLASLYLIELYKSNELSWHDILTDLDEKRATKNIQGFLIALSDCCLSNKEQLQIPDFLIEKLNQWMIPEQDSSTISA